MQIDRVMILLSGCFLIVWSTFKWKVPHAIWDLRLSHICAVILGLYNVALAIFFDKVISNVFFLADLILYLSLDIVFMIIGLKKGNKGMIKNIQTVFSAFFIILALIMTGADMDNIYSSIAIMCGMMMVISTPFQEAKQIYKMKKEERRAS